MRTFHLCCLKVPPRTLRGDLHLNVNGILHVPASYSESSNFVISLTPCERRQRRDFMKEKAIEVSSSFDPSHHSYSCNYLAHKKVTRKFPVKNDRKFKVVNTYSHKLSHKAKNYSTSLSLQML